MRIPSPDTTSLQDVYQMAGAEFVTETIASLKVGFPPRVLEHDASTFVRQVLSPQERITVEFAPAPAASKGKSKNKSTKPTKAATSTSTSTSNNVSSRTGRPQRQAAKAAQEAMPDIIKAQDQLLKEQSTSNKAKRKAATITSKSSTSPSKKKKAPNFGSQVGTGRRLADGAAVAAPKSRKRSGAASSSSSLLQPQQSSDMGESLLNALNHPGTMGQVLRKGMKHAVQASYETSRAFSRLAAIQAKSYQTQVIIDEQTAAAAAAATNNPNNNVPSSKLKVTYQGSVDKTWHTDTVDCIPEEVLTQVLQGIYDSDQQEALRPENLARLSPRVLWSLVHLYPRYTTIPECYQELLPPHLDWSFLRRRAEQLSEKAAENLRQAQAQTTEGGDSSSNNNNNNNGEEQALQAVAAVEHAMEHLHDVSQRRRLASEAALARLQPANGSNEQQQEGWKLETPSEEDREELIQIMKESSSSNPPYGKELDRLVQTFFDSGIHNWRELALVNKETAASLAPTLQVSVEILEAWIDAAQAESIPEIMVEVCDNRLDDVDLLIERARTSTPKDLALWRSMPQVLHSTIGAPSTLSVDTLCTWSERAHALLREYEWMNWYATPVE